MQLPSIGVSILSDRRSWDLRSGQGWYLPQGEARHLFAMLAQTAHCERTEMLGHAPSTSAGAASGFIRALSLLTHSLKSCLHLSSVGSVTSFTQKEAVGVLQETDWGSV